MPTPLPAPLPVDGTSPCQIFLDRMEDLGLQLDNLLLTLTEIDRQYRECLANKSTSPQVLEQHRRFETVKRIADAAKTALGRKSEI